MDDPSGQDWHVWPVWATERPPGAQSRGAFGVAGLIDSDYGSVVNFIDEVALIGIGSGSCGVRSVMS